jgi:hypothetical protein
MVGGRRRAALGLLLVVPVLAVAGCQRAPAPAPPPPRPVSAPPAPAVPRTATPTAAERSTAYSREHPWGEETGTARLHGTVTWAEGNNPPAPVYRRALLLRGLKGASNESVRYMLRTDATGEYVFDRILGGEYELTDGLAPGSHWRLRVQISNGDDMRLDLSPGNSVTSHDDFPGGDSQG